MKTRDFLWAMISYQPGLYVLNAVIWTLIHLSPLLPGLIVQQFFDMLDQKIISTPKIELIIILLIVTAVIRSTLFMSGVFIDQLHRFLMSAFIRRNILAAILEQPGAAAIRHPTGEVLNRFRDDVNYAENAVSWTLDVIGLGSFALVSIGILLRISPQITLFVFAPLVGIIAITQIAATRIYRLRKISRDATGRATGAISEMFDGVQLIKVTGSESNVIKQFRHLSDKRWQAMLKDRLLTQYLDSVNAGAVALGTGALLLILASPVWHIQLSLGDFALFAYYLGFVTEFTQFFGQFLAQYRQAGVSFERLADLVSSSKPSDLVVHTPIELSDATVPVFLKTAPKYRSLQTMDAQESNLSLPRLGRGIEGINLNLKKGSFTVITGRVASGKTTLLRTLLGLLPKERGVIQWNEEVINDPASLFVPPWCAYISQVPWLFSGTIKENILLGIQEDGTELEGAINSSVLEQDLKLMQNGIQTVIGPKGVRLSGGQIQRTAAARMFIRKADLLVMDDLSSALDVETEELLWKRVESIQNLTCIVVSHRHAAYLRADKIVILKEGRVEAEGTLTELLKFSSEMQELWSDNK